MCVLHAGGRVLRLEGRECDRVSTLFTQYLQPSPTATVRNFGCIFGISIK